MIELFLINNILMYLQGNYIGLRKFKKWGVTILVISVVNLIYYYYYKSIVSQLGYNSGEIIQQAAKESVMSGSAIILILWFFGIYLIGFYMGNKRFKELNQDK